MSRDSWFRNRRWSPGIEAAFFERLGRARDKTVCLRIQAALLAETEPAVSLRLLDQYFALGGDALASWAYAERAAAHRTLGQFDAAADAYVAALDHEGATPNADSRAWLEFAELVAGARLGQHYDRAVALLEANEDEPALPIEHYLWHGSLALILADQGQAEAAREAAELALAAAAERQSGMQKHPAFGLVGPIDDGFGRRLCALAEVAAPQPSRPGPLQRLWARFWPARD